MRALPTALLAGALGFAGCRLGFEQLPLAASGGATSAGGASQGGRAPSVGGGVGGVDAAANGGDADSAGGVATGSAGASPVGDAGSADGGAGQAGAPGCGDGVVQPDEECEAALSASEDLCQADCSYHWFDRSYAKRRRVTFANPGASELLSLVVPVVLGAAELDYGALEPNGEDLLFVDENDQATLSYEIEAWVPGGESIVWLRFPRIPADGSASAWLYYEKPGSLSGQDAAQTWSGGYTAGVGREH